MINGPIPLAPAMIAELEEWLGRIHKPATPEQFAARLYQLGLALTGGPPPRELFLYAAAIAIAGAELHNRPQVVAAPSKTAPAARQEAR